MIDLWTFSLLIDDIAPEFEIIDGRIYIDRNRQGREAIYEKINEHYSLDEAQYWINMVPIDDLIAGACGEWSISDPAISNIVNVYRRSWTAIIRERWGDVQGIAIEPLHDEDTGDLIIALRQTANTT